MERSKGVAIFLTKTCNRNYKECVRLETTTIKYCQELMKQCHETEEFLLPQPVSKIEVKEAKPSHTFSEMENEVNLRRCQKKKFYDAKICRHLCSKTLVLKSTRSNPTSPCESICYQLTRSFDSAGEVCPTEKYCRNGCPCPHYQCEKIVSNETLIPVFDLKRKTRSVKTKLC